MKISIHDPGHNPGRLPEGGWTIKKILQKGQKLVTLVQGNLLSSGFGQKPLPV